MKPTAPRSLVTTVAAILLTSCAAHHSVTVVSMEAGQSSIQVGAFVPYGPYDTIGGESTGRPTDNPPGTKAEVKTVSPVRAHPGTYRIMPPGVLRVMNIDEPPRYNQIGEALKTWRPILDGKNPDLMKSNGRLDELPWKNAAQCFHAKARVLNLPWGKAGLFLTTYVQGKHGGPVNNDELTLVVQGITNDGRHFVSAHLAIRHPQLPEDAWDEKNPGRVRFPVDDTDDGRAEAWLNRQPDDSFTPNLKDVETMLAGLKIEDR